MRMGGGPQQFGVDAEQVPALLAELAAAGRRLPRLPRLRRLAEPQRRDPRARRSAGRSSWCSSWPSTLPTPVRYLNLGGGFGIPYFEKDQPLDLAAVGEQPRTRCSTSRYSAAAARRRRVVIELGRYIVGECGVYVTRVVDRKSLAGQTFLVVDGGMHHQLAASGNFGQVIRRNYPVASATGSSASRRRRRRVVGCLCTPLDLLGDDVALPEADIGDLS